MMKRAILFRFHTDADVARNRLRLLRRHNPDVPIYGLYGGPAEECDSFRAALAAECTHLLAVEGKPAYWLWTNGDLASRYWFCKYGLNTDFEMLHVVEWDLLLLAGVAELYGHVPRNAVGITAPRPVTSVDGVWDPWLTEDEHRERWATLLDWAKRNYHHHAEPICCLGPGWCFPRAFLQSYVDVAVPEICHDELRVPLMAQVLGFPLHDTGICRAWMSPAEHKFFNCDGAEVRLDTVLRELRDPHGRRAFHPYRRAFVQSEPDVRS